MTKKAYPIIGMHCAGCKTLLEKTIQKIDGVKYVSVNFASEKLTVEYDETITNIVEIQAGANSAGSYKLIIDENSNGKLVSPGNNDNVDEIKQKEYKKLRNKVISISILAIPFVFIMIRMILIALGTIEANHLLLGTTNINYMDYPLNNFFFVQFVLSSIILFWGGSQFFISFYNALKKKTTNMDTLVVLGTTMAWIFSTLVTFTPKIFGNLKVDVFFEASVFIIFFILLGRLLESRAKLRANDAIKKLIQLQAKYAVVIRDNLEVKVPLEEVIVGDIVIVKPGGKIPIDGEIIFGGSTINESMVTGESLPTKKHVGDNVIGSTINVTGNLKIKAQKVGGDTLLSQIIKLVEEAQGTDAPIQKLADKISTVFVPIVLLIAVGSFVFWGFAAPKLGLIPSDISNLQLAIYISTTVMIIACPCALGLATPTAVIVGTGQAAKKGILIKNATSLEQAKDIKTIIFDKTGTLTLGKPVVTDFIITDNIAALSQLSTDSGDDISNYILAISALVEKQSEHPLSNAIVEKFETADVKYNNTTLELVDFSNLEGRGVQANVNAKNVFIGNSKLLTEKNITKDRRLKEMAQKLMSTGKTVVSVVISNKEVAIFAFADTLKPESKEVITNLNKRNIDIIILTGDNKFTADAIAKELGVSKVLSNLLPQDKLKEVQKIIDKKPKEDIIAMVGDGINDAPALAKADIGIAMGNGTDIAIETGDIIITNGNLEKMPQLLDLSTDTLKVIKQNLFWAFSYNILSIPIAAGILYPFIGMLLSPVIASAAMAMSSVSVVLNSLRLKSK